MSNHDLKQQTPCLQPLEFEDCLTDSPGFRENLKSHEKEIDYCAGTIKLLKDEMKRLMQTEQELSKCHKHFAHTIGRINFKPIGELTEDESEIEAALDKFCSLIEDIEDHRERVITSANQAALRRLERFRKDDIGRCKEEKKRYAVQTEKACSALEKSLSVTKKQKEATVTEIDNTYKEEWESLFTGSLHYVTVLHEIQERKKFEFVEPLLQYMYGWMAFYHTGYEAFKEFEMYFRELSGRLQVLRDTFQNEKDEADKLKERVAKRLTFGSTSSSPTTRQGYLYSREKLAVVGFGHSWTKCFCEYSSKFKTLNIRTYNQTQGRLGNQDQIKVAKVTKKRPEALDRRFCFEVTTADGKCYIFQALCEDDLKTWMEIMEGNEAHYAAPMQAVKLKVPEELGMDFVQNCISRLVTLGLREEGIYRVNGSQLKVNKLISATFEEKKGKAVFEVDDIKVIASSLKYYLRNLLPEPLMTYKLHDEFLDAMKTEDRNQKINNLKNLVSRLPKSNYDCLKQLIKHLNEVATFKEENRMHESNLGVVFGPTLMRPKEETVASIFNIKHQNILVENLIIEYVAIFEGGKMNETYKKVILSRQSRFSRANIAPKKDKQAPKPPSLSDKPNNKNSCDSDSDSPVESPDILKKLQDSSSHHYANSSSQIRWAQRNHIGAVPPQKPAKTLQRNYERSAIALYDCQAENDDELTFRAGDRITNIVAVDEDGWCVGTCNGHRGLVPLNFIQENNISDI